MAVLVNFKICDNVKECGGISVCPTKALAYDDKNKTIFIDNSKCINCMGCEEACPVDAIKVTRTSEEYEKIKKRIEEDQRKRSDLFVDRYGAQPIFPAFLTNEDNLEKEILESNKIIVAELFNNDSIMCLLHSITIRELIGDRVCEYRKVELKGDKLSKKYKIKKLPALVFFKNGKLLGKIEGYFDDNKKQVFINKIKKIIY